MSFTDKVILITGAGVGMGAHAALHLAKKGASIAMTDYNEKLLNETKEKILSANLPTPLAIVADITTDAERIITETVNHFGKLDILINVAGILKRNSIESVDLAEHDRIMNTNVRSIIALSKFAVPHLERTKGNILNVSSISGLRMVPNNLSYSISKAAVNQLTKSAALDLAPKGIRVNAINPSATRTTIFESGEGLTPQQADEFFDRIKNIYPIGRVGEVTDTSAAIEFLISDSASFITGVLLRVDGGAVLAGK